jgi:hypothetical protein
MSTEDHPTIPEEYLGRNIGQLGEDILRTWISDETSATLNPVERDEGGWDFFLEFPFRKPDAGRPWDTAGPRIQCLIQVKATDSGRRRRNVKLDNWQKLIFTTLPAFFLVFEFDGGSTPKKAFLVHVGREWMEKVLRRLRQSRPEESPPLNEQHVTLTWSHSEELGSLRGKGLVSRILRYIGDDYDAYVLEKQNTRRGLGLDAPFIVHVKSRPFVSESEMYREMVDFALGIKEWLPFSSIIDEDVRFGIPAKTTDLEEGLLKIAPEGMPITLIFQNAARSRMVEFPAKGYSADYLFPDGRLPHEFKKYRIEYELGEIIWSPQEGSSIESTFRIEAPPGPVAIRELASTWSFVTLLLNTTRDGLQLAIAQTGGPPLKIADISPPQIPKEYQFIAEVVANAWFVVRELDLSPNLEVRLEELIDQHQHLANIRALLDIRKPLPVAAGGKLTEISETVAKEHAFPLSWVVTFGNLRVFIVVGIAGSFRVLEDMEFEITNLKRVHIDHFLLEARQDIRAPLFSVYDRLREKGYEVIEYADYPPKE